MQKKESKFLNRELSWLSFNERVLQEAQDPHVPLLERIKFLGIFSNNLDEFFRVRVATNKRLLYVKKDDFDKELKKEEIKQTLAQIQRQVVLLNKKFDSVFFQLLDELKKNQIFWVDENKLSLEQWVDVKRYFKEEVLSTLFPLILSESKPFPNLHDASIYLAIRMTQNREGTQDRYAIVEIPSKIKGRFYLLPEQDGARFIMFLDDVIRANLPTLFSSFEYDSFEAYTIKVTRDAELDLDLDLSKSMFEKVKKAVKRRQAGSLVRFVYDKKMPPSMLDFFVKKLKLSQDNLLPGQRYHNFKDLMSFPKPKGIEPMLYEPVKPLNVPELDAARCMFAAVYKKDFLLHHPYQSFDYVVRFLRESAVDPNVVEINISLYRVAKHSNVVNALINAVKNGKKVFVMMELKARFDEESNIYWSGKLIEAGAEVFYGYENMKIHSKICLVTRKQEGRLVRYAHIGTGNYNGFTSRFYCDHSLFTSHVRITRDLVKVFKLIKHFKDHATQISFNNLWVAPINIKTQLLASIQKEINWTKRGRKGLIMLKANNLVDKEVAHALYNASQNGVEIRLIIRGICTLIPAKKGLSEHIQCVSILDKYLEHSRIYIFNNGGNPQCYFGSADLMTRNLHHRIEVLAPVFDPAIKQQFLDYFEMQWKDNTKARIVDAEQSNRKKDFSLPKVRSQSEIYAYLMNFYS